MCRKTFPHLLKHAFRLRHEIIDVSKEEFIVGLAAVVIVLRAGGTINRRVVLVRVVVAVQSSLERLPGRRIRTEAGRRHARTGRGVVGVSSILHLHGWGRWLGRLLHFIGGSLVDGCFLSKKMHVCDVAIRGRCGRLRGD